MMRQQKTQTANKKKAAFKRKYKVLLKSSFQQVIHIPQASFV